MDSVKNIPPLNWIINWTQPRSTERHKAFRERIMRRLSLIMMGMLLASLIILIWVMSSADESYIIGDRIRQVLFGMAILVGIGWLVHRQQLTLAAIFFVSLPAMTMILSFTRLGYWSALASLELFLTLILGGMLFSRRIFVPFVATLLVLVVSFILLTEQNFFPAYNPIDELTDLVVVSDTMWYAPAAIILYSVSILLIGTLMLAYLREFDARRDDLQKLVNTLEERVSERTSELAQANEEIRTAWEKAQETDQMKSQFLASMSHELRTPLNAILNFTEFVSMGMLGEVNEKQKNALEKSLGSGKHLLSLINDILDITKIESGMLKLFVEENVRLAPELQIALDSAKVLLQDKPVQLISDIDSNLPPLVVDRRRIHQILLNLLSNATKFTDEGSITLSVKKRKETILIAVIDTGFGIELEQQGIIFEPFLQSDSGIQHAQGTGLGLPISKRLAEAHEGKLWVESELNEGTAFYLELPIQSKTLLELARL